MKRVPMIASAGDALRHAPAGAGDTFERHARGARCCSGSALGHGRRASGTRRRATMKFGAPLSMQACRRYRRAAHRVRAARRQAADKRWGVARLKAEIEALS